MMRCILVFSTTMLMTLGSFDTFTHAQPPGDQTDLYGDPLPEGAVMRLGTVRFRLRAYNFAFAPDGRTIVAAAGAAGSPHYGSRITFWDADTGHPKHRLLTGEHAVYSFAWNSSVQAAFTLQGGFNNATQASFVEARVWDIVSGRRQPLDNQIAEPWYSTGVHAQQAPVVFTAGAGEAVFWDAKTGEPLARFECSVGRHDLAVSDDGRLASAVGYRGGKQLLLFDQVC